MLKSRRTFRVLLATGAVSAAVLLPAAFAAAPSLSGSSTAGQPGPDQRDQGMGYIARQAAARNGEPNPHGIEWVRTTRGDAVRRSSGAEMATDTDTPVFLVQVAGSFSAVLAHRPPGEPAPVGSYITLVVDARSHQVLDFGLTDEHLDLARIGPVEHE